ncbi:MAG: CvpA family protein [Treponema sp.]|nr:CvpA family protein [Candidatus Treponema equifaecale]
MTFSFIDIIFLVIILFFALTAMAHGLIKEVFGKLAVIAGLFVAFYFCGMFSSYFKNIIDNPTVDVVLSFLSLFIVTFIVVKIVQIILGLIFSGEILGSLNRVLGLFFGLIEGALVVCCILILLQAQPWFNASAVVEKSTVASILLPLLEKPISYLNGMFA